MRRSFLVTFMLVMTVLFVALTAAAQFKIPKLPKPKTQPTPTETAQPTPPSESESEQPRATAPPASTGAASRAGGPYAVQPEAPAEPQFLPDTLEIQVEHWDYYWKIPNDNHNTSWAPRIRFFVFYGGSTKLRFKADYFMPDGSLWFSEALEYRGGYDERSGISLLQSESDSSRDKKTIVTGGLFGIKITNIRDNSTVFQGKFKVNRYKPQYSVARYKNEVDYYVDYDWKLPIGLADLEYSRDVASPIIRMWFKGDIKGDNLEARIFHEDL